MPTGLAALAEAEVPVFDDEPSWLTHNRVAALAAVAERGYPTRKDEDWRYVRLDDLYALDLEPAPAEPSLVSERDADVAALLAQVPDLGGARLVFVDGRHAPHLSRLDGVIGLEVADLEGALRSGLVTAADVEADGTPTAGHAFAALSAALASAGAVVKVEAGAQVTHPVHLVQFTTATPRPALVNLRSLIDVGEGASLPIVVSSVGSDGAVGCTNTSMRVRLATGARLEITDVQDQPIGVYHLGAMDVTQAERSHLVGHVESIGGAVARHEIHVRQLGEAAVTELDGLYVPRGDQQHDHPVLIEHFARDGVSRQNYRGVVDDRAHGVFNGTVIVHEGAVGINSDQSNKNLLLSDRAEVDTRPRLEIYADDVECSHGAAVGRLDDQSLYYLRSRGIPEDEARRVLTFAFVEEIVEKVPAGPLRDRVEALVSARLHPDPDVRSGGAEVTR